MKYNFSILFFGYILAAIAMLSAEPPLKRMRNGAVAPVPAQPVKRLLQAEWDDPEKIYNTVVALRIPAVLEQACLERSFLFGREPAGVGSGTSSAGSDSWLRMFTDKSLSDAAGDVIVQVEVAAENGKNGENDEAAKDGDQVGRNSVENVAKDEPQHVFGKGFRKAEMPFSDVLKRLSGRHGPKVYATTQDWLEEDNDSCDAASTGMRNPNVLRNRTGRPAIAPPLVRRLSVLGFFPLRPNFAGNLIPASLNMWVGGGQRAKRTTGTTTGLHHDFHDNFYLLVRGRKRFTLFPPSDVHRLYTHGAIRAVHPNGLIEYQESMTALQTSIDVSTPLRFSDGSWPGDAARNRALAERAAAEAALDAAEATGDEEAIERAEARLDAALDAMLSVPGLAGEDNEGSGGNSESGFGSESEDASSTLNEEAEEEIHKRRAELESFLQTLDDSKQSGTRTTASTSIDMVVQATDETEPDHFCRVDPIADRDFTVALFPEFANATPFVCDLNAGDVLFLPAGWFHHVVSLECDDAPEPGHIALNYWFHPAGSSTEQHVVEAERAGEPVSFMHPYVSDAWPADWKSMSERYQDCTYARH